jgi:arginase family protein
MKIICLLEKIKDIQVASLITKFKSVFSKEFCKRNLFYKYYIDFVPWNDLQDLVNKNNELLFLGYDHSITAKIFSGLNLYNRKIIIFDAHNDFTSDEISRELLNWNFINYIEKYFTSGLLLGYRHYNTNMNKSKKIHYIHSFELENPQFIAKKLRKFVKNQDIYISIDFDIIEPKLFNDVDFPVPGGISYNKLIYYLNLFIQNSNKVIIDISEYKVKNNINENFKYYKKLLDDIDYLFELKKKIR